MARRPEALGLRVACPYAMGWWVAQTYGNAGGSAILIVGAPRGPAARDCPYRGASAVRPYDYGLGTGTFFPVVLRGITNVNSVPCVNMMSLPRLNQLRTTAAAAPMPAP